MPASPAETEIHTLNEYTHFIEQDMSAAEAPNWYRGCGDCAYKLQPTLYRHPTISTIARLLEIENQIMSRFRQRSVPYHNRPLTDEWENLFLMQHFGVPTRLLDWTENPFVALYFALSSAKTKYDGTIVECLGPAAVWILDPYQWNRKALAHITFKGGILSTTESIVNGYKPSITDMDLMNSDPVAIYGTHNSPRIVAQRGAFTVFGKNTRPMEQIFTSGRYPAESLRKLVVPATSVLPLLSSLFNIGMTESTVFPDLEGLAREMKREMGYR